MRVYPRIVLGIVEDIVVFTILSLTHVLRYNVGFNLILFHPSTFCFKGEVKPKLGGENG